MSAESGQPKKPQSFGEGIRAGLRAGITGASGHSVTPRAATTQAVTLDHVPDDRVDQVIAGFEATGAAVEKTRDGPNTWKVVATWP